MAQPKIKTIVIFAGPYYKNFNTVILTDETFRI